MIADVGKEKADLKELNSIKLQLDMLKSDFGKVSSHTKQIAHQMELNEEELGRKLTLINTKHADVSLIVDDQVKKVDWIENINNSMKLRVTEFGKKFKD